jgi:hypothetical protein
VDGYTLAMDRSPHGWKAACTTVLGAAATCEPTSTMFGCTDCRAAYCATCAGHLSHGCPRCLRRLDEITKVS